MIKIGVFGRSDAEEGSRVYEECVTTGKSIAERGHTVVCGGYGGVMEAVCRGAKGAGGETIGVTCLAFNLRKPNSFLTIEIKTSSLADRMKTLIDESDGFLTFEGKTGTLNEIVYYLSLSKMGLCKKGPMVLVGKYWDDFKSTMLGKGWIGKKEMKAILTTDDPLEAIDILERSQIVGTNNN